VISRPRGLLVITASLALVSLALGFVVTTAFAIYNAPQLFLLGIGNVTIKTASSISIFTSITPMSIAYSLRDMGVNVVPEVLVLGTANGTPVVIRGITQGGLGYYCINASINQLNRGALVGYSLARELGIGVGSALVITSFKDRGINVTVEGIVFSRLYPQLNYEVLVNLSTAQYLDDLPPYAVSVIYANMSRSFINLINRNYRLGIITVLQGYELTILNSMNNTVINEPLSNTTIALPFGAYYVLVHNGSRVVWYGEVLLNRDTTIMITKPLITNVTITVTAPTSWVYVTWPNGTPVNEYYLGVYSMNGTQVLYTLAHGVVPIALPPGDYRFVVSTPTLTYSVVRYVRAGANVTIVLTPYTTLISGLSTYAPSYLPRLTSLVSSSGPVALLSILRVGVGVLVGLIAALLVILMLGVVGVVRYYYGANEDLINYLKLNRAGALVTMALIDLPMVYTALSATALGLFLAYLAWPLIINLLHIALLSEPLSIVKVGYTPYVMAYIVINLVTLITQLGVRRGVVGRD